MHVFRLRRASRVPLPYPGVSPHRYMRNSIMHRVTRGVGRHAGRGGWAGRGSAISRGGIGRELERRPAPAALRCARAAAQVRAWPCSGVLPQYVSICAAAAASSRGLSVLLPLLFLIKKRKEKNQKIFSKTFILLEGVCLLLVWLNKCLAPFRGPRNGDQVPFSMCAVPAWLITCPRIVVGTCLPHGQQM